MAPTAAHAGPIRWAQIVDQCGATDTVRVSPWYSGTIYDTIADDAHLVGVVDVPTRQITWHSDAWKAANPAVTDGRLAEDDISRYWTSLHIPAAAYHQGTARIETRLTDPRGGDGWQAAESLTAGAANTTCSYYAAVDQVRGGNGSGTGDTWIRAEALAGVEYSYVAVPATKPWPTSPVGAVPFPAAQPGAFERVLDLWPPREPLRVTVFRTARQGVTVSNPEPQHFYVDGRKAVNLPLLTRVQAPDGRWGAFVPAYDNVPDGADGPVRWGTAYDVYYRLNDLPKGTTFTPDLTLTGELAGFRRAEPGLELTDLGQKGFFLPGEGARSMDYRLVYREGYRSTLEADGTPTGDRTGRIELPRIYTEKDLAPTWVTGRATAVRVTLPAKPGVSWTLSSMTGWSLNLPEGDKRLGKPLSVPAAIGDLYATAFPTPVPKGKAEASMCEYACYYHVTPADVPSKPTAPRILIQPKDARGEHAAFGVGASGNPAVSYQWQSSADGNSWTDVASATGSGSVFFLAEHETKVYLRARVSNTLGTVYSRVATLTRSAS